jgi:GPH family glycoside/pentoside/hexuronide:cation symporter
LVTDSNSEKKPYTANRREIYARGVGGIANHALICTSGQVTNIFILGYGLSPILVSWVMTLPRFLDGIVDPWIGHLSDNTHTRWGRRKPFLVVGSILAALFLAGIWWVNRGWGPWVQFIYVLVCTSMFYTCWGIYSMAWTAIGYELTDDYHA